MNAGDVIVCADSRGYTLTKGKEYTVVKYEPRVSESGVNFTWPAYVWVNDDKENLVCCHACRFMSRDEA